MPLGIFLVTRTTEQDKSDGRVGGPDFSRTIPSIQAGESRRDENEIDRSGAKRTPFKSLQGLFERTRFLYLDMEGQEHLLNRRTLRPFTDDD